jgi:diguanylate cyclase (GGDEF)-like protein
MSYIDESVLSDGVEGLVNHLSSGIGVIDIYEFQLVAANHILREWVNAPLLLPEPIESIFPEITHKHLNNILHTKRPCHFKIQTHKPNTQPFIDVLIKPITDGNKVTQLLFECIYNKTKVEIDALIISYEKNIDDYKQQLLMKNDHTLAANLTRSLLLEHMNQRLESKVEQRTKELEIAYSEISHQANHDVLTNLPNRRLFDDCLKRSVEVCQLHEHSLALFCFDLDNFKKINDLYGHRVGDILLQEVASRIAFCLRPLDIFARTGGDEFSIILEDVEQSKVADIAKSIIAVLSSYFFIDGHELYMSVSIGICMLEEVVNTDTSIAQAADAAMHKVKAQGKNNFLFFSDIILRDQNNRANLEIGLRKAIKEKQFFVVYQPKVNLETGNIAGCEVLVRWAHPERGILYPDVFIPVAEAMGLIAEIGLWVLEQAIMQMRDWHQRNVAIPSIAVNISGYQLNHIESRNCILAVLDAMELDASMLEFELTESVLMNNQSPGGIAFLTLLRERGHIITIDDFGTGYSSLSYLQTLPVTTLKIDKSFVLKLSGGDKQQAALVNAILALAKIFHLSVVAEGIDTEEQLCFLREAKCDFGQGYFISKPISAKEIERFSQTY